MVQRDQQLARTATRWPEQLWGQFIKITLGYGYQPWRALLFLAALVVVTCLITIVLGSHGALERTDFTGVGPQRCSVGQLTLVAWRSVCHPAPATPSRRGAP